MTILSMNLKNFALSLQVSDLWSWTCRKNGCNGSSANLSFESSSFHSDPNPNSWVSNTIKPYLNTKGPLLNALNCQRAYLRCCPPGVDRKNACCSSPLVRGPNNRLWHTDRPLCHYLTRLGGQWSLLDGWWSQENKCQFWLLNLWWCPLMNTVSDTGWRTEQERKKKQ